MEYGIATEFWAKPIPPRQFDWAATYDNYDGAEDSSTRGEIGYGVTEEDAVNDLLENYPRDDRPRRSRTIRCRSVTYEPSRSNPHRRWSHVSRQQ
jgi:hypothetical protein